MNQDNNKSPQNGKGDAPRNIFSDQFRANYAEINWKQKETKKPETNTYKQKKP